MLVFASRSRHPCVTHISGAVSPRGCLRETVVRYKTLMMTNPGDVVKIYTNAPAGLDMGPTREVGELGILRVVDVEGERLAAEKQLALYREGPFFSTFHKPDAAAFVSQDSTFERPSSADIYKEWKKKGSIDLDKTMPLD